MKRPLILVKYFCVFQKILKHLEQEFFQMATHSNPVSLIHLYLSLNLIITKPVLSALVYS